MNPLDTVAPLRALAAPRGVGIGSAAGDGFRATGSGGELFRERLAEQFDVLTSENAMKFDHVHPAAETYSFAAADALVDFAESNGMAVRGHTLVWHQQLPSWVTGGSWTAAQAEELLREHAGTVTEHFAGRVVAWDVVNEALEQDGSLRPGFWADHIGRDYIEIAFETAHAADPGAELFYNDYGIAWLNEKSDSVYAMLADLLDRGVPVHGIGFQGHFQVGNLPSEAALRSNFQRFGDLGLTVHVTELDVRIPLPASESELQQQGLDYRRVVEACLAVQACEMVVSWGFTDRYSWVPDVFPGSGAALMLTAEYEPKPAYWGVHGALSDG
ncbi:MAG: endo-1,4-beta-xylanase [Gemmatimonadota bacterium]